VVTVLRKGITAEVGTPIPEKARLMLWSLAVLDVMTVAWMLSAGDWLDRSSAVSAVVTLGGHHIVVLCLALVGFATLTVVTMLTRALAVAGRLHLPFIVLGALASVVALGGVLAVTVVVVGAMLLVAVVGGALSGRHVVFHGSPFRRR
jgi:quinol-cytochrome oxidoreductase complex cytochrome b subunit